MTKDQIAQMLAEHQAWLEGKAEGKRADLSEANLRGAYLSEADLSGANLSGANLSGANLRGADLCGANLCGAGLRGANLRDADLCGANLRGADLCGADLRDADLCGADTVIALGQPNGWWGYAYLWEDTIWVRIGCRTKSISEGRAYWAGKAHRREVLAALDYAEMIARLRGWEMTL